MNTLRQHTKIALTTALFLFAAVLPASGQSDDIHEAANDRPGSLRPGWYLGIEIGGSNLDLDKSVVERFATLDVDLSSRGQGGGVLVGYSFSNRLNLELSVRGRTFSTGRRDINASVGELELAVLAPLRPEARVSPYIGGSVGSAALGFYGDGVERQTLVAGQIGMGGGVEIHLTRHFTYDLYYRASVQRYNQEIVELKGGGDQTVEVEGSGQLQDWGMRIIFSF